MKIRLSMPSTTSIDDQRHQRRPAGRVGQEGEVRGDEVIDMVVAPRGPDGRRRAAGMRSHRQPAGPRPRGAGVRAGGPGSAARDGLIKFRPRMRRTWCAPTKAGSRLQRQRHRRHRLDAARGVGEPELAERQAEQRRCRAPAMRGRDGQRQQHAADRARDGAAERSASEVPRKRAPITTPVATKPEITRGCGKRPCTRPVACSKRARDHGAEKHAGRHAAAAPAPPPARRSRRARRAPPAGCWSPAPAAGVAPRAPPLAKPRIGGISATRVKTRMLCASTTRGRSAVLPAAITTTEEKAPGMEAKRAVTRSQPCTRSR